MNSAVSKPMPKSNNFQQNDDVDLMLKLKDGDYDAFTLLFNKHRKKILDYFHYHYNPYPYLSAEDYTQEVFLKLWKSRERYNPQGNGKFSAYLLAIAANFLNDCRRKAERELITVSFNRPRHPNDNDSEPLEAKIADEKAIDPSEALLKKELEAQIEEAINSLPKGQREVCLLIKEGFSYKEIARILDCPLGTVRSREHRARKRLRDKRV